MNTYQAANRRQGRRDWERAWRDFWPTCFALTYIGLTVFVAIASFPR